MAGLVQMARKDIYSSACLTMEWKWVPYLPQLKCDKQDVLNFSDISSADKIVKKKKYQHYCDQRIFCRHLGQTIYKFLFLVNDRKIR